MRAMPCCTSCASAVAAAAMLVIAAACSWFSCATIGRRSSRSEKPSAGSSLSLSEDMLETLEMLPIDPRRATVCVGQVAYGPALVACDICSCCVSSDGAPSVFKGNEARRCWEERWVSASSRHDGLGF